MSPDTMAGIVATVLNVKSATAYAPRDPAHGIVVIPDEVWIGGALIHYVRINTPTEHNYPTAVELHTDNGTYDSDPDGYPDGYPGERVAYRILSAILAVATA
ncbi:hypothetical protein [Microbacterium sp. No. 7]|uniref:hypothetical protein n=1 Tax=Microbacterium sp. No. 7 TaxID=1714373 RepID=UPI0006ECF897|nr:hypothetical protein [Microbacterium sp. No. 7]ALJ19516.1 hypothetical protein AOA12_06180 [Microbacterium sp. No. 7]